MPPGSLAEALARLPRARLATLPTPLERGPRLPGGARLWMKRDDLTGLGMGGNKARKLERLCGAALAEQCDLLVTVGASQSNHCRQTAAAGAVLGLPVHLVVGGSAPAVPEGNQVLSVLFGAELHYAGTSRWEELEAAKDALVARLRAEGRRPAAIPIGGSTPVGALGFAEAFAELVAQCDAASVAPRTVVVTTSSGGTHAGLLAGRAALRAEGIQVPDVLAVAVAPGVAHHVDLPLGLAGACLELLGLEPSLVGPADVQIDAARLGPAYAVPTPEGDDAIRWAARRGGWVLDRTYTGKGFSGVLGAAAAGRWGPDDDVVFWHTGGQPAVFTHDGLPFT